MPIEVLIDTLLANKNADIERLRQQLEELQKLLDKYEKLDLTEDQKRQLAGTVIGKPIAFQMTFLATFISRKEVWARLAQVWNL